MPVRSKGSKRIGFLSRFLWAVWVVGPVSLPTAADATLACLLGVVPGFFDYCPCDCNASGEVTVDEIVAALFIALDPEHAPACQRADPDENGTVSIDEIVAGVNSALEGCRVPQAAFDGALRFQVRSLVGSDGESAAIRLTLITDAVFPCSGYKLETASRLAGDSIVVVLGCPVAPSGICLTVISAATADVGFTLAYGNYELELRALQVTDRYTLRLTRDGVELSPVDVSFSTPPPTATRTATPSPLPTPTPTPAPNAAAIAAELLTEILPRICFLSRSEVQTDERGAWLECSTAGHIGSVSVTVFSSPLAAAAAFEALAYDDEIVEIGGSLLKIQAYRPTPCCHLTQHWAWSEDCWLVRGYAFDDTDYHYAPQPRQTVEAILGSALTDRFFSFCGNDDP